MSLGPQDVGEVERFGDLLLVAMRRIREMAASPDGLDAPAARHLLDLAKSARRQLALRDDLLLRNRRVPSVAPLQLLRAEASEQGRVTPESLRPGGAVSLGTCDYLVTALVSYLAEGRRWHALILRGEEGERRLQVEPGADTATFMEPSRVEDLPDHVGDSGTASVSIEGLAGQTEGVVVDYRLTIDDGGHVGWWEHWPDGERCYLGRRVLLSELRFWPAAVGGMSSTRPFPSN